VNAAVFGAFLHQGQICMSARKIIVERPIADEFISKMVEKTNGLKMGDPKQRDTIIGPLINEQALAAVRDRVESAVAGGAKLLAGGSVVDRCFQPTLLGDVPEGAEFSRTETFGPVASIEVVENTDEAVQRANASSYGLAAGIITQNSDRGFALAQRIDSGIVHVNDQPIGDEPQVPFGGVKESGFGRFGGKAVVDEFTELRWITVQSGSHPFPF
jgi:acyl-CoA reductase-like NAD-dependent aldehyde dehydrogenase